MTSFPQPFQHLLDATASATPLPASNGFPDAWHSWSDVERHALIQAWASGRPLLVRGEPGCGKSQLARAVAAVLGVPLFAQVVHPRFEATDVLYRIDLVARLAQAQLAAALYGTNKSGDPAEWLKQQLHHDHYITKGVIWQACAAKPPMDTHGQTRADDWPRAVVLLDEIDKADSDVPNALLEYFANRSFSVPGLAPGQGEIQALSSHLPLTIITTNEDRELPPAFVRRCAVLNLRPADATEQKFLDWLQQRAQAHHKLARLAEVVVDAKGNATSPMARAAAQVWADREAARPQELPSVGLAEYLDLLYSLQRLSGDDPARAMALLDRLAPFALVKHRDQDQTRKVFDSASEPA
jgi:MoxR-like ATPase